MNLRNAFLVILALQAALLAPIASATDKNSKPPKKVAMVKKKKKPGFSGNCGIHAEKFLAEDKKSPSKDCGCESILQPLPQEKTREMVRMIVTETRKNYAWQ
jgi:hypothetical protein